MLDATRLLGAASLVALAAALPANTSDPNDDDFACYSSIHEYITSSWAFEEQYTTDVVTTYDWVTTVTDRNVPLTTLCDGRPRALESFRKSEVTSTVTVDEPLTFTHYSTYTGASPTCTVAETACAAIMTTFPDDTYPCQAPVPYTPCSLSPDYCIIAANYDQTLYYWPVTTVSGDFCAQNGSTVFAQPTSPPEPNTVVVDGYTYTSPTNYLSFAQVGAVIHGQRPHVTSCGPPPHYNVIVPITEPFSSSGYKDSTSYTFNFADMNTLPVSAYNRQRKCGYEHTCSDIIEGSYTPIIPLPMELLNLEPEWKSVGCRGSGDGIYITPVALATPAPTAPSKLP